MNLSEAIASIWWPISVMAIDWLAVARSWKRLEYAAKPAAIVALLAWLGVNSFGWGLWTPPLAWFAIGLVFSLAGDVLLLLPERYFLAGLVAFLLGHIAYIFGLNAAGWLWPTEALLAIPMVLIGGWLVWRIGRSLQITGRSRLKVPIVVYTAVISLMVVSAAATLFRSVWPTYPAALIALGAILFFTSDALLAWNRFVAPIARGKMLVIVAYHLGQMLLILGAVRMVEVFPGILSGYAALVSSLK